MSAVLNDRDAILQAATVRIVNPRNAWINLTASAPGFHLNTAGQVDLAKVTVTADLIGLDDAVVFTAVGGTLSNAVGRSVDVTYAGQAAIVTAKVVSNGDEFQRALVIPVLRDGAAGTGTPGARGAGQYYVVGSAWADVAAQAACPGGPVVNDQVTISNGTVTYTKRWDGSVWYVPGAYLSGGLFVEGDIHGSKLKVGTVQVTTPAGVPVVTIGGLQPGFEAPGTKNSEQQWSDLQGVPYQSILNNDDSVAMGFNPTFSDWPTGVSRPTGWAGQIPVRDTTIKRLGQWGVRFNTPGGAQVAINRRVTLPAPLPIGTFVAGTYDLYIDRIDATNTTGKPGLMVRLWWGTGTGEYTDRDFPATLTAGAWQRINFTARQVAGRQILQIEFYLFGSFSRATFGGHFFGDVVFDNFRFALFDTSLDNTTISMGANGALTGAGGGQVTITGLGYTGALNATNGAPAGTTVGGTDAGLVASRAMNGDSAYNAVNNATTGLAAKLSAAGNQNLAGPIALTANGAVVVGTINDGVRINTSGIIGRKAGYTTFSIAADGTAVFGGTLTAASGTLGSLRLPPGGGIMSGSYTGYDWPASGQTGCYYGPEGILLGNARDGKFVQFDSNGTMLAPGFQLLNGQLTLTSTVIINPRISQPVLDSFAYTVAGGGDVSGPNGQLGNSVTLTISGNNGPHKIVWNFARLVGGPPAINVLMDVGDGGRTAGIGATASNTTISVQLSAVITGSDGRTLNYSTVLSLTFGTM